MSEKSRMEEILKAMLDGKPENMPEPQSRMEEYLQAMATRVGNLPYETKTPVEPKWIMKETSCYELIRNEGQFLADLAFISGNKYIVTCNGISKEYETKPVNYGGMIIQCIGDSEEVLNGAAAPEYGFICGVIDIGISDILGGIFQFTDPEIIERDYNVAFSTDQPGTLIVNVSMSIREAESFDVQIHNKIPAKFIDTDWMAKTGGDPLPEEFLPESVHNVISKDFISKLTTDISNSIINELTLDTPTVTIVKDENTGHRMLQVYYSGKRLCNIVDSIDIYKVSGSTYIYTKTLNSSDLSILDRPVNYDGYQYDITEDSDFAEGDRILVVARTSKHGRQHIDSDYSSIFTNKQLATPVVTVSGRRVSWNPIINAKGYYIQVKDANSDIWYDIISPNDANATWIYLDHEGSGTLVEAWDTVEVRVRAGGNGYIFSDYSEPVIVQGEE